MNRFAAALAVSAVALGAGLMPSAEAAYSAGTVAITPVGLSSQVYRTFPYGASSAGVLFSTYSGLSVTYGQEFFRAAATGTETQVTGLMETTGARLIGDLLYSQTDSSTVYLQQIGGPLFSCPIDDSTGTHYLLGVTSVGLIRASSTDTGVALERSTIDPSTQMCGAYSAWGTYGSAATDYAYDGKTGPNGIVVPGTIGGTATAVYYPYANPGSPVTLNTGGAQLSGGGGDVGTNAMSWYDYSANMIKRTPLDGSPTVGKPALSYISSLATFSGVTLFLEYTSASTATLGSMSADGLTITRGTAKAQSQLVGDTNDTFYLERYAAAPTGGLYRGSATAAAGVNQTLTLVRQGGRVAEQVGTLSLSQGRTTYVDNKRAFNYWSLFKRSLSGGGATAISYGSESLVSNHASRYSLSVSGRRTAFTQGLTQSDIWLAVDGLTSPTRILSTGYDPQLSGFRLVYQLPVTSGSPWRLRDLRPGRTAVALPAAAGYTISGDYLYTVSFTGGITRKTLSTGSVVTVRAATPNNPTTGVNYYVSQVSAWGTVVAWSVDLSTPSGSTRSIYWKDLATGVLRSVRADTLNRLQVSAGHILWTALGTTSAGAEYMTLRRAPITSTTVTTMTPDVSVDGGNELSGYDERVGYLGTDGRLRVSPLPAFSYRPRYLGLAYAESSFKPGTTNPTWSFEAPFDKSLTSCTVRITSGATTVRSLGCASPTGTALVTWDGKNSAGAVVPAGTYRWTVFAGDADGTALSPSGGALTLTGTFTRTA